MKTLQKKFLLLLLILPISIFAQTTLKGVVIDGSSNLPLPGVNILVEGTKNGTTTDFDGNFIITNLKKETNYSSLLSVSPTKQSFLKIKIQFQ